MEELCLKSFWENAWNSEEQHRFRQRTSATPNNASPRSRTKAST